MPHVPPAGAKVSYHQQFRRCGKAGCPSCRPGQPGHGPYWYATWWADGRVRSQYLGRQAPAIERESAPPAAPAAAPTGAAAHWLRVRTLGGFTVWRGGTAIPARDWARRKVATSLFKYLLVGQGYRAPREALMDNLWPDAEPAAAAANLRYTVHLLRKLLDAPEAGWSHLRTEGDMLVLLPAGDAEPPEDWLDARAFERAAERALAGKDVAACTAALALYGGEYLPDDPYGEWATARREELRARWQALLLHLAALSARQGDTQGAMRALQQVLAADPCHEEAARALLRLQAAAGRRTEAMATYQRLVEALKRDLEVAPEPATTALYRDVVAGKLSAPTAAPAATDKALAPAQPAIEALAPGQSRRVLGRAEELKGLERLLQAVQQGRGGLALVGGPAGIGKSRLLAGFLQRARGAGALVLAGKAYRQEGQLPYGPLQDAVRGYVAAQTPELLRTQLAYHAVLVRLVPELARLVPDLPVPAPLDPKGERHRLFAALAGLLEDLARKQPLVLALEDLQWADVTTIQAVHYLQRAAGNARVLIIATYRAEDVTPENPLLELIDRARRGAGAALLELHPFDRRGIGDLLADALASGEIGDDVLTLIAEKSRGNPLFVRELVAALRDAGTLEQRDGVWRLREEGPQPMPAGIQALVLEHIGRLDADAARLARLCAVVGQESIYPVLRMAGGLHEEALLDALESLLAAGVLEETAPGSGAQVEETAPGYTFHHPLFREVLYRQIPAPRRALLHRKVGESLEEYHASRATDHAATLAWHFSQADLPARAAHYSLAAGRQAADAYALPEAIAHFQAARAHLARTAHGGQTAQGLDLPPAWQVDERIGDLRMVIGDYAAARDDFARACEAVDDLAQQTTLWRKEAGAWQRTGEFERALETLARAEAEAAGRLPATDYIPLLVGRGSVYFQQGAFEEAHAVANAAIAMLGDRADDALTASVYTLLGGIAMEQSEYELAETCYRRCLAIWERDPDNAQNQQGMARMWIGLGLIAGDRGEYEQADAHLRRALALYERIGSAWGVGACLNNLGNVALSRGNYAEASRCYHQSLAVWERTGDKNGLRHAWNNLGSAARIQGELDAAESYLQRSLAMLEQIGATTARAACWENLGEVARVRGDLAAAEERYRQAEEYLAGTAIQEPTIHVLTGRAIVARARGDLRAAVALCRSARQLGRAHHLREAEVEAILEGARTHLRAGRTRAAAIFLEHGQHLAQVHGLARATMQGTVIAAELAAAQGAIDVAARRAEEALRLASEGPCYREMAQMHMLLGYAAAAMGEYDRAERELRRALAEQTARGMQLDAACTRLLLAAVLAASAAPAAGAEAAALRAEAQAAFDRACAAGDAALAQRLVRAVMPAPAAAEA